MTKYLIQLAAALAVAAAAQARAETTTWDGIYSAEQADRGEALYMSQCSQCHGPQLGGIDAAPALTGGNFASNWSGVPLDAMLERIRISMPQNAPGTLSRKDTADVMAFLMQANGFPTGESDLPRQAGFLRTIIYQAQQP
ncbi:MAG: cytochrome c [Pseudomonadales bacterium]